MIRRHAWSIAFISPMLILFLAFTVWPMAASWFYAFFEWNGIDPLEDFVGLQNFAEVIADPLFWNAAWHSLLFSLGAVLIEIPLALILASLLNKVWLRGRNFYRLLLFLPVVSTTAVIGVIFVVLLDPASGPINEALKWIGFTEPVNFLGEGGSALPTIIAISIWKGFGVTLVYWLAALQTVPTELYEAAAIDGANARQTMWRITLPIVAPIAIVILVLTFERSLQPFDLVQAMTQGGPGNATEVEATYVYSYAFDPRALEPRYGFASAAGAVFGVLVLCATLFFAPIVRWARNLHGSGPSVPGGRV